MKHTRRTKRTRKGRFFRRRTMRRGANQRKGQGKGQGKQKGGGDSSAATPIVFMPRGPGCSRGPMTKEAAAKFLEEGDSNSDC